MILKALLSLDLNASSASANTGSSSTASSGWRGFHETQEDGHASITAAVSPEMQLHCNTINVHKHIK